MHKIMSIAALAGALAVTPMLGSSPAAHAQGFSVEVGPGGVRAMPNDPYGGYERPAPRGLGCSERQALSAAREEGLRRAEVVRVTPRAITVEGYSRGGPERIRFANEPGCPTIG